VLHIGFENKRLLELIEDDIFVWKKVQTSSKSHGKETIGEKRKRETSRDNPQKRVTKNTRFTPQHDKEITHIKMKFPFSSISQVIQHQRFKDFSIKTLNKSNRAFNERFRRLQSTYEDNPGRIHDEEIKENLQKYKENEEQRKQNIAESEQNYSFQDISSQFNSSSQVSTKQTHKYNTMKTKKRILGNIDNNFTQTNENNRSSIIIKFLEISRKYNESVDTLLEDYEEISKFFLLQQQQVTGTEDNENEDEEDIFDEELEKFFEADDY
jgi:hypothetical protein